MAETKAEYLAKTLTVRLTEADRHMAMDILKKRLESAEKPIAIAAIVREGLQKLYKEEFGEEAEK